MSKAESRTYNSIRNMRFAIIGYMISLIVAFFERKFFVLCLSTEYLGLSGVISNVISMLSIAELGFGEAIMYSLYKPIFDDDKEKIKSLIDIFKKSYSIIALLIMIAGLVIIPFLPNILGDTFYDIPNVNLIYILFLFSTVSSYIGAHRRSLIIAYQKRYIVSFFHNICRITMYCFQIFFLFSTKNFIYYIIITILFTLLESIGIYLVTGKMYPIVKEKCEKKLEKNEKKKLYKNIGAMASHKIGGTIVNGTDNLIISAFCGTLKVGLYSNYLLIKTSITAVTSLFFQSMVASMGNLSIINKKHAQNVFYKIFFLSTLLFGWCSISLFCLYNDFISLWIGKKFLLNNFTVILIVLCFYLNGIRQPVLMTRDSLGLFWYDRYKPIAEAIINLVVSLILAKYLDIAGVILGTIISVSITCIWVEPYILFKYGFNKKINKYFKKLFYYSIVIIITGFITWNFCSLITFKNIYVNFLMKCIICLVIPNVTFILFTYRMLEFKQSIGIITKKLEKIHNFLKRK